MTPSQIEQVKLLATLLNTAAGSCITVGVFAPVVALLINLGDAAARFCYTCWAGAF